MSLNPRLEKKLRLAIKQFWTTRQSQALKQGGTSGKRDSGQRSAVTGGAQMNGFVNLVRDLLCEGGLPRAHVYCDEHIEIPGWYRPEKKWDLLVVANGQLLAGIKFKSQVGSFGNNYNNRTEEAIGSAVDVWAAYMTDRRRAGCCSSSRVSERARWSWCLCEFCYGLGVK